MFIIIGRFIATFGINEQINLVVKMGINPLHLQVHQRYPSTQYEARIRTAAAVMEESKSLIGKRNARTMTAAG
jgi:hypothetical protein